MEPFRRDCRRVDERLFEVIIGDFAAIVPENSFWKVFSRGWELDTERIFRSHIAPGSTVLDIGAWIGPTLLFACACGAERIIALEPNPQSHDTIRQILALNPLIARKTTLLNQAVSSQPGTLRMGLAEGESDTSTSGIGGDDFEVETTTIEALYRDFGLDCPALVKIDIEGAEALLANDFTRLAQIPGQVVHLSIHVPFFPEFADKTALAESLRDFDIKDDRGQQLTHDELTQRILSDHSHPDWGTKHGNFFELLLRAN